NGIMADGYMNFGTFGLLLWAVGLVALLKLGDAVARGKDRIISVGLLLLSIMTLVDGYLLTTFLSHGLLLAMFLVWLLPKSQSAEPAASLEEQNSAPSRTGAFGG
ncbi:MAG: hypothetical protein J5J00_09795, partial [Deltaproteobacteria bacterium]|nr:hypothetical protein [Deltaproteobacteria bacterium]